MSDLQEKLEEFHDKIQIGNFSSKVFQGSDFESGYIVFFIDDEDVQNIFNDQPNLFKKIASDLYIASITDFEKIDGDYYRLIQKKYHAYFKRDEKKIIEERKKEVSENWDYIREFLYEINSSLFDLKQNLFFKPTVETINWAFKSHDIVVTNRERFGEFCKCLHQLGKETITDEGKEFIRQKLIDNGRILESDSVPKAMDCFKKELLEVNNFYTIITDLRDMFSHIQETLRRKNDILKSWNIYFTSKIGECPSSEDDYFNLQIALLKDFKDYLKKIRSFFYDSKKRIKR